MTSTTFFIIFIPILAGLLLAVNLILAPHNPYQEKDSPFECGFDSFRAQNRTEFNISFYLVGIIFIIFDVEVIGVTPYFVAAFDIDLAGLFIMELFFGVLTVGLIFEINKDALTIDNDKTSLPRDNDIPKSDTFINKPLQSSSCTNMIFSVGATLICNTDFTYLSLLVLLPNVWKAVYYYFWAVPQLFSDYLRILKDKTAPGLEWALHNPPKPHAFYSLPLQSMGPVSILKDGFIKNITLSVTLLAYSFSCFHVISDAPRAWGLYFQDSASPQMEALVELHDNIMYYLVAILFAVGWIQGAIIKNFESSKSPISNKYLNHGTLIELIWTITPALILVLIAFPSFKLLYLMDEVTDPSLSVLAEGHQWYWSYEYPDFLNSDGDFVEFDSYLVPESDLEKGALRMLEVDNRVILPEITHTRFILTAADVIHSFAIPALGVKCDAYPGRLNQFSVLINRLGTFYGQCSEICGILHSSMPIVVESVPLVKFLSWLDEQ